MDELDSLSVVEIKQLLRKKGLRVSGKKSELIARLSASEEKFLAFDEGEITAPVSGSIQEKSTGASVQKRHTSCSSCRAVLKYPSNYLGMVTCPQCKHTFEINLPPIGVDNSLFLLSIFVFALTLVTTLIIASIEDATSGLAPNSGMFAMIVGMGGLTLSVILFVLALIFKLAKIPLNTNLRKT
jgi:LSD1 subclass zinc finger protein